MAPDEGRRKSNGPHPVANVRLRHPSPASGRGGTQRETKLVPRVLLTEKAADLIARLKAQYGALMFHQSGGCCDGSTPMCFAAGEFKVGEQDVLMGEIADCKFYIGANQFEYWRHTQLIIDVVPGRGAGFTLEAPEGVRFLTRSRVFSDAEVEALNADGEPPRGV